MGAGPIGLALTLVAIAFGSPKIVIVGVGNIIYQLQWILVKDMKEEVEQI